ncbi:F-box only protein 27-like isoform X2 [Engystomops pustulosus]|uniref:F-box only protein 27-like isoform X2 n=1 Tax=Engystomops pustulosus TaxID=76066 RepID=UPI003AFA229C
MGQGGSQELPSLRSTVNPEPQVEFFMDLEPFPDDILVMILSFVQERDLILHCRRVSRRWKHLVDAPSLWRIKCERERRREILHAAEMCPDFQWQRACLKNPFSRNLLRNPCGTERLNHWSVMNGGDGWSVEENRTMLEGAESQTSFVTSFSWCKKSQVIDLVQDGLWGHYLDVHQPIICISDWYAGRNDCGCVYGISVQLLAADRKTVIKEYSAAPDPIPQWNDEHYRQVSHEFQQYGPGVRYVNFTHKGKDTQFWKGWYGPRISNSSVTLKRGGDMEPCR